MLCSLLPTTGKNCISIEWLSPSKDRPVAIIAIKLTGEGEGCQKEEVLDLLLLVVVRHRENRYVEEGPASPERYQKKEAFSHAAAAAATVRAVAVTTIVQAAVDVAIVRGSNSRCRFHKLQQHHHCSTSCTGNLPPQSLPVAGLEE
nr:hypothetical protein Iba_chr04eCG16410 [Ipomoea batatas]